MLQCYNFSTLQIKHSKADSVAIKIKGKAVKVFQIVNGSAQINTSDWTTGDYVIQFFKDDEVIDQDILTVKQNLKYTDANYDPRSEAQKILEAINAVLAGRATQDQYHVKVGEKEISYCTFNELMNFKNYYQKLVARQNGKPTQIRHEKLFYRTPPIGRR